MNGKRFFEMFINYILQYQGELKKVMNFLDIQFKMEKKKKNRKKL